MPVCDADFDFDLDLTFTSTPAFDPRLRPSTLDHRLRPRHQPYFLFTSRRPSRPMGNSRYALSLSFSFPSLLTYLSPSYIRLSVAVPSSHPSPTIHFRYIPPLSRHFPSPHHLHGSFPFDFFLSYCFDSHADSTSRFRPSFLLLFKSPHPAHLPPTLPTTAPNTRTQHPNPFTSKGKPRFSISFFFTPRPSGRGDYASSTR
ncbi:hypothetical protein DFH06DRAFT_1259580 [Mycena polygramma]|nr:hypothetical protein DFH06DRAFT_1259580 [Mycena polygramma]